MKIFEFKSSERDCIYAADLPSAIKYYSQELDLDLSEIDEITQVPKEEWSTRKVYDYNEYDHLGNPLFMGTFEDLAIGEGAELISSTVY